MASLVTLASLRTQAQQRADMENSNFLSPTEWNTNINDSARELYDLLVGSFSDYFLTSKSFTVSSANDSNPLPGDFYKLLGVDEILNGTTGEAVTVKPYEYGERNSYMKLSGSGRTINMDYIPVMTPLVNDSDTFDGINGWERYIIVDAAIKAMIKEESDTSDLRLEKTEIKDRIIGLAPTRDAGMPSRIVDIHRMDPWDMLKVPSRLRYRILGQTIKFVECFTAVGYPV